MHIHRATQQKTELYNEPTLEGAKKQLRKELQEQPHSSQTKLDLLLYLEGSRQRASFGVEAETNSLSPKVPRSRHLLGGGRDNQQVAEEKKFFFSSQNAPSQNVFLFLRAGVEFLWEELEEAKC